MGFLVRSIVLFLVLLRSSCAFLSPECTPYQCAISSERRVDCSYKENNRDACLQRGCCFDNSIYGNIWCFYPIPITEGRCPHPECQVLPNDREACFESTFPVSKQICEIYGCCYEDTESVTPCFRRKVDVIGYSGFSHKRNYQTYMSCRSVDPFNRRQCGPNDVDQEQCTRFRCCWVKIGLVKPRCFYPKPFPRYLLS